MVACSIRSSRRIISRPRSVCTPYNPDYAYAGLFPSLSYPEKPTVIILLILEYSSWTNQHCY